MKRGSAGRLAVVLMALISTLLLAQGTAMAASFTFLELTDRVALSVDTEHAIFNCGAFGPRYPKACELIFASPTGTTTVDALRTGPTFWTEPETFPDLTVVICDFGCLITRFGVDIGIAFATEAGGFGTCRYPEPCGFDDGSLHTVLSITWRDAAGAAIRTDTISFQSNVPEPASALLLFAGFGAVAMARRRARR